MLLLWQNILNIHPNYATRNFEYLNMVHPRASVKYFAVSTLVSTVTSELTEAECKQIIRDLDLPGGFNISIMLVLLNLLEL